MSALSSSLLTGLSGLVASQTELSVVGNNIANANTTAFKSSQVQFAPQFYVTDETGTEPNSTFGGTDPSQVGLGTEVAQISQNLSQGELQTTGISTDLAINGNGYFILQPAGSTGNQSTYTRDGAFSENSAGNLVDSSGDFLMGYNASTDFKVNTTGTLTPIVIPKTASIAQATQTATLSGVLTTGGTLGSSGTTLTSQTLVSSTGTLDSSTLLVDLQNTSGTALYTANDTISLSASEGGSPLTPQQFAVQPNSTVGELETFLNSALNIVPPSDSSDPTPGVSIVPSGSAAGTGTLQIVGNIGTVNALSITNLQTTTAAGGVDPGITLTQDSTALNGGAATGSSFAVTTPVFDSLGNQVNLNVSTVETSTSDSGTTWEFFVSSPGNETGSAISSGTLSFDTQGHLVAATGTDITLDRAGTGAEAQQPITLDFSGVTANNGTSPLLMAADGVKSGNLDGFSIGADGVITGSFDNGLSETIGQVALASFTNPSGLNNLGNNQYAVGPSSGQPTISTPGSGSTGSLVAGSLEMSNVDLSQEFINLIIASTGYDASSRVISTGDQLLQELLSSQR